MSLEQSDSDIIERARIRVDNSGVDPLTVESVNSYLDRTKGALSHAPADQQPVVQALMAGAVSFAHFVSGAREISRIDAQNAVTMHVAECARLRVQPMTRFEAWTKIARVAVWPLCIFATVVGSVFIAAIVLRPELAAIIADAATKYAAK
jgi:hypothetical protein